MIWRATLLFLAGLTCGTALFIWFCKVAFGKWAWGHLCDICDTRPATSLGFLVRPNEKTMVTFTCDACFSHYEKDRAPPEWASEAVRTSAKK